MEEIVTTEIIQSIIDTVDKKKVQSLCKKVLKKCSFKSANDMNNLLRLANWLYVYGYCDEAIKVCDLVRDIQFNGNYTVWSVIDSLHCQKARILRERGEVQEAKEIVDFVNKYRSPELYKNIVDWFLNTLDTNIRVGIEINSKSSEYQWRIAKMNCAIKYKEAGQFPVSDEELERIIREQIEVLSKVK